MLQIRLLAVFLLFVFSFVNAQTTGTDWWKETFVYQIYPRSFQDSNGDGVGDLKGITSRLDYLKELGVETIWLSPFYKSPMDDMGYDISDYYAVDPVFGTMADFQEMLAEIKKRNIRLIVDLVVNHSSDEHEWFKEARKSRDNPFHDFYMWKSGERGTPPNNWLSVFGGSAWEWNEATQEYYLHLFTKKQPDLNWENEKMRGEIYKMMRFWLDKGVDGFRMDVIPLISKRQDFPTIQLTGNLIKDIDGIITNGPRVHEYLQEMNREVLSHYDIYTVGEGAGVSLEHVESYVLPERKELQTIYHFEHMDVDRKKGRPVAFEPIRFKKVLTAWNEKLDGKAPNTIYLGNHDQVRSVSRFGNDKKYRIESGKMLATLLFTQSGIPFFLQGDELGMTNSNFRNVDELRDVATINAYTSAKKWWMPSRLVMNIVNKAARDQSRTPFQWNNKDNAGFSSGKNTWLGVNPNYTSINAQQAMADPNSIFHFYKNIIQLRKQNKVLVSGIFKDLAPDHAQVYAYTRTSGQEQWLIILNMTEKKVTFKTDSIAGKLMLSNYTDDRGDSLRPFEAKVYKMIN